MSAPILRWLQIHQYEQFEPVRIEFSARENLLLGINGAGKTRLLKLILAVLSLDFSESLAQSFDISFELHAEPGEMLLVPVSVSGRISNSRKQPANPTKSVVMEPLHEFSATLRYRVGTETIRCDVEGNDASYQLESAPEVVETLVLPARGWILPRGYEIETPVLREMLGGLWHVFAANHMGESDREFDALTTRVSFYAVKGNSTILSDPRGDGVSINQYNDIARLLVILTIPKGALFGKGVDLAAQSFVDSPFDVAAINRLFPAIGVRSVRLVPRIVRAHEEQFECRGVEVRVHFFDGTEVADTELTFGQRRFLYAGLVFTLNPGKPVLIDELDNGLHPDLVATLLDLWQERQLFLVSHNKMIIDHTNFAGPEDVQAKVHIIRRDRDGRQTVVRFDEAAAREVYEKIAVAIQSPSEVLRAEGLW